MLKRLLLVPLLTLLIATGAFAESAQHSSSGVYTFDDGAPVEGAHATLVTNDSGAAMSLHTSGLTPGHAVTVWWVIFNFPEHCTHGIPGLSHCGEEDLHIFGGDPSIQTTVAYAAGHVIGGSGRGNYGGSLTVGDTSGVTFGGPGLLAPRDAEIHLVVRTHGPAIPGLVHEQIRTFGAGCIGAPPGTGTPGDYPCEDLQFAVFQQ